MTFCHADFNPFFIGGDKTRSGLLPYFQGIQPNIPARTTFIYANPVIWVAHPLGLGV